MDDTAWRAAGRRCASLNPRGALVVALAAFALPRTAAPQTHQELATRRLLIEQATAERAAGHHAQALALSQRAGAVLMTPSVRLFIAQELDATGDSAGALGQADQCIREVDRDLTVVHRAMLRTTCQELVQTTRAHVGYLVVRAPEPVPDGLLVRVGGAAFNLALVGVPNVVSPGPLTITASAPGRLPFSASRVAERGATVDVTLELPPEPVAPPVVAAPVIAAPVIAPPVIAAPVRVPPPLPAPQSPRPLAPRLLLGGGAAALVGGVVLLVVRASALDGCTVQGGVAECDTPEHLTAAQSANGLAAGGGILVGVGAAALGAGVLWLLLDRASSSGPAPLTAGVAPARDGVAFGLTARFP